MQDGLLRSSLSVLTDLHRSTTNSLGVSLNRLKSKTKTLHSSLSKKLASSDDLNTKKTNIEKSIIAALSKSLKEEEATEAKSFEIVTNDDDEVEQKLSRLASSRVETRRPMGSAEELSLGGVKTPAQRETLHPIVVKTFFAKDESGLSHMQRIEEATRLAKYLKACKIVAKSDIKLLNIGNLDADHRHRLQRIGVRRRRRVPEALHIPYDIKRQGRDIQLA